MAVFFGSKLRLSCPIFSKCRVNMHEICPKVCAFRPQMTTSVFCVCRYRDFVRPQKRSFSAKQSNDGKDVKPETSKYMKPRGRIRQFAFGKFFDYVMGYEKVLEKNFPRAFHVYQVFAIGIKEFYKDIKLYASVVVKLRQGTKFSHLTRYEIERYHADTGGVILYQYPMPQEIRRVSPVLIISALPFANYVIFPLAYMFPKQLLSSHFWNLQQKAEFAVQDHRSKLFNYRSVFRHLQTKLSMISDVNLRDQCSDTFQKLGSGTQPTVDEILGLKHLFTKEPYGLRHLSFSHVSSLCRMHRLWALGLRRRRLWFHAGVIRQMDLAILREDIATLNSDHLRYACFLRGINPIGMTVDEMITWLRNWITVTQQLDADNLSLLLHCPVLLAYNSPTNWSLIH